MRLFRRAAEDKEGEVQHNYAATTSLICLRERGGRGEGECHDHSSNQSNVRSRRKGIRDLSNMPSKVASRGRRGGERGKKEEGQWVSERLSRRATQDGEKRKQGGASSPSFFRQSCKGGGRGRKGKFETLFLICSLEEAGVEAQFFQRRPSERRKGKREEKEAGRWPPTLRAT